MYSYIVGPTKIYKIDNGYYNLKQIIAQSHIEIYSLISLIYDKNYKLLYNFEDHFSSVAASLAGHFNSFIINIMVVAQ